MKKSLLYFMALVLALALAACAWTPDVEGESWVLEHVLVTDEAGEARVRYASEKFLAENAGKYADAETVAFTLRAKDGKIEIKNVETGELFLGTYGEGDSANPEQTFFSLKFGKRTGSAVAELYGNPETGEEEHLLTVSLAGYTMVFVAE